MHNSIKIRRINILLFFILLFSIGEVCVLFFFNNPRYGKVIEVIGLCGIISTFLTSKYHNNFNPKIKFIYNFYLIVAFTTIFRGLIFTPHTLFTEYCINGKILTLLIPLIALLNIDITYVKYILRWSLYSVIFAAFFLFANFHDLFLNPTEIIQSNINEWDARIIGRPQVPATFTIPICAFLFLYKDSNRNSKWGVYLIILLASLAALLSGRRSTLFTIVFLLIPYCFCYIKRHWKILLLTIFILTFTNISTKNIDYFISEKFAVMYERIDSDTRSGTENDFYKDMQLKDWIFGRGLTGTFKSPSVAAVDKLNRTDIETGYLTFILKGGLILLIPYLIILINSAYKGLSSNNIFCKYAGFYIFAHILYLYPSGFPELSLRFFILWFFVIICQNKLTTSANNYDLKNKILL